MDDLVSADRSSHLVIQGLLAECDTRDATMARQHAQIMDLVAEADALHETLAATTERLRTTTQALQTATRAIKSLRNELARYTHRQVAV